MDVQLQRSSLNGWGGTCASVATLVDLDSSLLPRFLLEDASRENGSRHSSNRGFTMRGLGRSYGDAAQNGGGVVVRLTDGLSDVRLDETASRVQAPAGVTLDELITFLVPRGYFVPVTPGTRFVTVGGAIASDIHGKNHHVDGSFGSHVESFSLLLADGDIIEVSQASDPELFWATIGGMGLTGAILGATFSVVPIETSLCRVETRRFDRLDSLIEAMSVDDDSFKYSVAWADLLARGPSLGRSILWRGEHARREDLPAKVRFPLEYSANRIGSVPPIVPRPGVVNRYTSSLFNELWFRATPKSRSGQLKSIPSYFHPLDSVGDWNRLYGPGGFIQYQFVLPFGAEDVLRDIVRRIADAQLATPLVVLKRFGKGNPGMLSFPAPGWTLTVDMPATSESLSSLLLELDELVLDNGGRHYLAKDSHMTPRTFRRGYPRLNEWRTVKDRVDPNGIWTSDLARRLEIFGDHRSETEQP